MNYFQELESSLSGQPLPWSAADSAGKRHAGTLKVTVIMRHNMHISSKDVSHTWEIIIIIIIKKMCSKYTTSQHLIH